MNINEAYEKALSYVNGFNRNDNDSIIIVDQRHIKKNGGWLFFYDSKKFLESKSISYALAGNGPIIVSNSGKIIQLGTLDWEKDLLEYENSLK